MAERAIWTHAFSGVSVTRRYPELRRGVGGEGKRAWESLAHTLGLKWGEWVSFERVGEVQRKETGRMTNLQDI